MFFNKSGSRNIGLKDQICLIKMFKIVDKPATIDIKACFDVMLDVFLQKGHDAFEIMGDSATGEPIFFKKLNPFYKAIRKQDVACFSAYFDESFDLGIHYWDMPLNPESESDKKRFVDFFLAIPYEWYSLDQAKAIVTKIDAVIGLCYGYVNFVPCNYCIDREEAWVAREDDKPPSRDLSLEELKIEFEERAERSNAIVDEMKAQKREMFRHVNVGQIPKHYPVNFYNSRQLEHVIEPTERFEKISNNLTLVTNAI